MNEILSTAKMAEALGITSRRLRQLSVDGIVPAKSRGKYEITETVHNFIAYRVDLERQKYKKNDLDINMIRKRRELAEAELKEIELAKTKGELLEKEEVVLLIQTIISNSKTKLLGLSTSLAKRLLMKKSAREIKKIIDEKIYEVLNELSTIANK